MRTASGLVKGGLLRGKQSEPVKSVYLDPWLPETARYNFSDKSENAERRLVALTQYPFRVLRHSLRDGARVSSAKAPARAVFCCLCHKSCIYLRSSDFLATLKNPFRLPEVVGNNG